MLIVIIPTLLAVVVAGAAWRLRSLWRSLPRSNADFGL